MKSIRSLILISVILFSCNEKEVHTTTEEPTAPTSAKNIILLIGDGMGLSEVSASQFYNENPSNFDRFPVIGLSKTSASDNLITDSAAGATAFASGIKTYNGAIGVNPDTIAVPTIIENLSAKEFATGVIATSSITHATPASFYAHVKSRSLYEDIAAFLPTSEVDFFAGGGLQFFNKREDKTDLIALFEDNKFHIDTTGLNGKPSAEKQGFLLAQNAMPTMETRGDFLPKATQLALDQLSKNEQGFFLVVEGSQIDWGGHGNDATYLIAELIDFDTTIGVALDFAEKNSETLVIVTADHETGGFTLSSDERGGYNKIKPTFSTDGHSATMVPVFAKGPGASAFGGVYQNNAIYQKMMDAIK